MGNNISLPTFATHYFLPDRGPFRSLSDLPLGADDPVFRELLTRHKMDPAYRRRFGSDYICRRKAIEAELRQIFLRRGGVPTRETPFYLTLGASSWFKGLNEQHEELRIPLLSLNPLATSVTFPDSFIAMTKPDKPYYKKVFLLRELQQVIDQFGLPVEGECVSYEGYWRTDFELYIELQVWEELDVGRVFSTHHGQRDEA